MTRFFALLDRILRGPRASALLRRMGIEPRKFWLLLDLFAELSERGEIMDQLGRDTPGLKKLAWVYFAMSCLMGLGFAVSEPPAAAYSSMFLGFTMVVLLSVLALETSNSLVNPVEGLVLAHQPIDGGTYIGAKLTHLLRIVLYLVPGINAVPTLALPWLAGARWWSPAAHMAAALALGILAALLCCALFGWLLRLVPPPRLKGVAQVVAGVPFLFLFLGQPVRQWMARAQLSDWLPDSSIARWVIAAAAVVVIAQAVMAGLRCLSLDYLLRVSAIAHGRSGRARIRRSVMSEWVGRWCGGPPSRAGFAFVAAMMRRDFQFRRQLIPSVIGIGLGFGGLMLRGWRHDPFSPGFTTIHALPHLFGVVLFFICCFLPYGNDYKGAWVFLLAPAQAFRGFVRGAHAMLWITVLAIPHGLALPAFAWSWGLGHAGLFLAYSLAVGSLYLAVALRLVDGPPFAQQMDPKRGAILLPVMIGGGLVVAIMVGLQHLLLFRSILAAGTAAVMFAGAAWVVTRRSLETWEVAMRYQLGLLSEETGTLYREVDG